MVSQLATETRTRPPILRAVFSESASRDVGQSICEIEGERLTSLRSEQIPSYRKESLSPTTLRPETMGPLRAPADAEVRAVYSTSERKERTIVSC